MAAAFAHARPAPPERPHLLLRLLAGRLEVHGGPGGLMACGSVCEGGQPGFNAAAAVLPPLPPAAACSRTGSACNCKHGSRPCVMPECTAHSVCVMGQEPVHADAADAASGASATRRPSLACCGLAIRWLYAVRPTDVEGRTRSSSERCRFMRLRGCHRRASAVRCSAPQAPWPRLSVLHACLGRCRSAQLLYCSNCAASEPAAISRQHSRKWHLLRPSRRKALHQQGPGESCSVPCRPYSAPSRER